MTDIGMQNVTCCMADQVAALCYPVVPLHKMHYTPEVLRQHSHQWHIACHQTPHMHGCLGCSTCLESAHITLFVKHHSQMATAVAPQGHMNLQCIDTSTFCCDHCRVLLQKKGMVTANRKQCLQGKVAVNVKPKPYRSHCLSSSFSLAAAD